MTEETTVFTKTPAAAATEPELPDAVDAGVESHFFNISLRGLIALILVLTFCYLAIFTHTDKVLDAFIIVSSGAISWYFSQNKKK